MKKLLAFLLVLPCLAQGALTLTAPSNPRAGTTVTYAVALSGSTSPAAIQWNFSCDHAVGTVTVSAAGTASATAKTASLQQAATPGSYNMLIAALNNAAMADGLVANITVALPTALGNTTLVCSIAGNGAGTSPALGASSNATVIVETPNPSVSALILPSVNFCDVNASGLVDSTDVTIERAGVLTQTTATAADRNGDGKTDVVDLMIVTLAATGGTCTATQ